MVKCDNRLEKISRKLDELKLSLSGFREGKSGKSGKRQKAFEDKFHEELKKVLELILPIMKESVVAKDPLSARIFKELVTLSSRMGFLELAQNFFTALVQLPDSDKSNLLKLRAGSHLVRDYSICNDFGSALAVFEQMKDGAGEPDEVRILLKTGVKLVDSLGNSGMAGESVSVFGTMEKFRGQALVPLKAEAAMRLVRQLRDLDDLPGALDLYERMRKYETDDKGFACRVKAGLCLFLPLARGSEKDLARLMSTLAPGSETPFRRTIRDHAALSMIRESLRTRDFEEARGILEVMEGFSDPDKHKLAVLKGGVEIILAYAREEMINEAYGMFGLLPTDNLTGDALVEYLNAGFHLVYFFKETGDDDSARRIFERVKSLLETDDQKLTFVRLFRDLALFYLDMGYAEQVSYLFSVFKMDIENPRAALLFDDIGHTAARALADSGEPEEAALVLEGLRKRETEDGVFADLQTRMRIFNGYLSLDCYDEARDFWRKHAVFEGRDKVTGRWAKATEQLAEAYVECGCVEEAREIYLEVLEKPKNGGENYAMSLHAVALELMMCYCQKEDFKNAREVFDMLPDHGSKKELEREKFELFSYLLGECARGGRVKDAVNLFDDFEPSADRRLSAMKIRTGNEMIALLAAKKQTKAAAAIYERLKGLAREHGLEAKLAKPAMKLVSCLSQEAKASSAFELLKTIPLMNSPKDLAGKMRDLAHPIRELFSESGDKEGMKELDAFLDKHARE
ncbi:MAG: hypothetical protein LBF41_08665 [Deltaproteobacteria bacterium]|jgi:tetratricopeptide (TPR) repeat protein|nr:hypothetical protein [Deltaproteobacteria bacterium]